MTDTQYIGYILMIVGFGTLLIAVLGYFWP